jgi:TorA maturation chaperone TorD
LAERYLTCFGVSLRGRAVPYECEYGSGEIFRLSVRLSDLAGFYRAFGLKPAASCTERQDHIALQCEFMSWLCARECLARKARTEKPKVDLLREAQQSFLRDHLGSWGLAFARGLSRADPEGPYGRAAALLEALLRAESAAFGLPAPPAGLRPQPPPPSAEERAECPAAPRDGQAPGL